jgi:hypothetical protein
MGTTVVLVGWFGEVVGAVAVAVVLLAVDSLVLLAVDSLLSGSWFAVDVVAAAAFFAVSAVTFELALISSDAIIESTVGESS